MRLLLCNVLLLVMTATLPGCASGPNPQSRNTALDAGNLVEITQKMAQSMAAEPRVQEAIGREGALKVVVEPVENHLRFN